MRDQPEHFVQLLVLILTYVVSRDVAYLLGPYIAIGIASAAGAALALGSNGRMSMRDVVFYVGLRIVIAMVLTVSIAEFINGSGGLSKMAVLGMMPVIAFGIGVIRDYRSAAEMAFSFLRRIRRRS